MAYVIISPRVGIIGETYHPRDTDNVAALVDGGFIKSTTKVSKSDKPSTDINEEN